MIKRLQLISIALQNFMTRRIDYFFLLLFFVFGVNMVFFAIRSEDYADRLQRVCITLPPNTHLDCPMTHTYE